MIWSRSRCIKTVANVQQASNCHRRRSDRYNKASRRPIGAVNRQSFPIFQKRSDRLRQLPVNSDRFRLLSDRYRHFPMDSDCFPTDSDNLRSTPTLCESFRGLPIMQFHAKHNWDRFGAIPTCFRSIPALSDPFRPFSDRFRHFPINSDCFPFSFEAFRVEPVVDNGLKVGSVEPGWSGPTYFVAIWMLHTGCCSKQHSDVSALSFRHFP
jgi:hypothetical protein